jgi:hydroxymethylglutaryl-CoA synthase
MTAVGIDAVEVWTGKLKLDLAETFAPAKGEDPEKYTKGLGLYESSFPDAHEDIVTMGANAARRLMERRGITPEAVGRIDVATESSFDNSKPVSTYVAGCLEQVFDGGFRHANKGERKFACLSGTQSLDDAYNWIRAGRNRGRAALVVATDTALYERGDPGEATQGAGAVAMLVDEDPALVEIAPEQGVGSADETDFLKPGRQFPSVDGKRSVQVYLSRMREALEDFEGAAGGVGVDDYRYTPFHTPFPGMVRKAAALGYRHLVRDSDTGAALAEQVGPQPSREAFDSAAAYDEAVREFMDALRETAEYQAWHDRVVDPTLDVARRVGNWYTGSVHVARVSALHSAAADGEDAAGERLLVGSYGSGAQAEIHAETVADGWREEITALGLDEQMDARYDLDFEEYERIHARHDHSKQSSLDSFTDPEGEFVRAGTGPMGEREYEFVG